MNTVSELRRQSEINSKKTIKVKNPTVDDFTHPYEGKPYTIQALDIAEFPYHIGQHIKKHLANYILNKRGVKVNPQDDLKSIYKELEV